MIGLRGRGACAMLTAIWRPPFMGRICPLRLARLGRDPRSHPSRAPHWMGCHRHASRQDAGDAFSPAASRRARQPRGLRPCRRRTGALSRELCEIDANVRTFEAITRSAHSGKLERV
jgi:hypothetical protein